MNFLAPAVLDYVLNNELPEKIGNSHPVMAPHGTFPSQGDDRWVAVACETEEHWHALCEVVGFGDEYLNLGLEERRNRSTEIEEVISDWSAGLTGVEAQELLQAAGVPAHQLQNSEDLANDPQLQHRRHFREVASATNGTMFVEGTRFQMSRSTDEITDCGPTYGQHTFQVLEEILGYDADRIAELAVAGVLE